MDRNNDYHTTRFDIEKMMIDAEALGIEVNRNSKRNGLYYRDAFGEMVEVDIKQILRRRDERWMNELFEECRSMVTYHDLDLFVDDEQLVIGNGSSDEWRIRISRTGLSFRPYHELDDDLIIMANNIRKHYFNVA